MAALRRPLSLLCLLVAVVVGVEIATTAIASAAPAGDPAAVAKVTNLNKKALDAYAQQDYDTARDLLKQALEVCQSADLDQHPITARTHIHFGVVAIVGFKQREVGLKQFRKALEIEPDIKLTKSLVTPELQDAFEEAVLAGDNKGGAAAAGGDDQGKAGGDTAAAGGDESGENATAGGDEGDEDNPHPKPKPRKKKSGDDDDDKDKNNEGGGQKGTIFVGLTIGSSAGIASGSGHMDPAHQLSGPGFAVGQLGQIEPQIGYFLNPTMLLSLVGRLQYVSGLNGENACGPNGNTFCNPTTLVGAVLARATFLMTEGPFRFTVGGQVGAGYVAHALVFTDAHCAASSSGPFNTQCVDALLGGPFLIGPTAGFFYELGDSANIIVGVNTELGAPKFTFNFDIDVGLAFRL
jgi:Tetratricopeptide repeat